MRDTDSIRPSRTSEWSAISLLVGDGSEVANADRSRPSFLCRLFYHLKKDVFPFAYFQFMTKGIWYGKDGLLAPKFD